MNKKVVMLRTDEYIVMCTEDENYRHIVSFNVYEVSVVYRDLEDDENKVYHFHLKGSSGLTTTRYQDAEVWYSGTVKWDGCSDITFFQDYGGHEHFCGIEGINTFTDSLNGVYKAAKMLFQSMDANIVDHAFPD